MGSCHLHLEAWDDTELRFIDTCDFGVKTGDVETVSMQTRGLSLFRYDE